MVQIIKNRWLQGYRTVPFPGGDQNLPERFHGRPQFNSKLCPEGCNSCVEACPTEAISLNEDGKNGIGAFDLGRCLFCNDCVKACPQGSITLTQDYRLAATQRDDLMAVPDQEAKLAKALDEKTRRIFGRSLKLREVCAGGCGACEAELAALGNVVFDLSRFGIQFVASPRHADGLIITGPVTQSMRPALRLAYDAIPVPKIVIAVGACAISGGPFAGNPDVYNGAESVLPVDLFVPGCPPHPWTILDGLLRLLGRIERSANRS